MLLLGYGFAGADTFAPAEHAGAVHVPQREIVRLEMVAERLVTDSSDPRKCWSSSGAPFRGIRHC